jgi:hypothetical protein
MNNITIYDLLMLFQHPDYRLSVYLEGENDTQMVTQILLQPTWFIFHLEDRDGFESTVILKRDKLETHYDPKLPTTLIVKDFYGDTTSYFTPVLALRPPTLIELLNEIKGKND